MITYTFDPKRYYYKKGNIYSTMTHEPLKKYFCGGKRSRHPMGNYVCLINPNYPTPHRYYLNYDSLRSSSSLE